MPANEAEPAEHTKVLPSNIMFRISESPTIQHSNSHTATQMPKSIQHPKMPPELYALPFTPESPSHFVHIVTSLLSSAECSSIINNQTNLTPSNVTASTRRDREIFDDNDITELVWERLKQFYGADRIEDEDGEYWAASGLNSRWRLCRYGKGMSGHISISIS
jgi:hypothetical protein